MTRHNKLRYQSKEKPKITILLTGSVYLEYEDDDEIAQAAKGDVKMYPQCEALHTTRKGDYWSTGMSGYFKADVHDGKTWQPVLPQGIFDQREQHFSKTECPIDTYELCKEIVAALAGKPLMRTYREHYTLDEVVDEQSED